MGYTVAICRMNNEVDILTPSRASDERGHPSLVEAFEHSEPDPGVPLGKSGELHHLSQHPSLCSGSTRRRSCVHRSWDCPRV